MQKPKQSIISQPATVVQPQFKVNFNDNPFNDSILNKGYRVLHKKALRCPCLNRQNGEANPSCENCGGSAWFYVETKKTWALVQGIYSNPKQENWSEVDGAQARITMRGEDAPTIQDTITVLDLTTYFSQVVYPELVDGRLIAYSIYDVIAIDMAYTYVSDTAPLRWLRAWNSASPDDQWDYKFENNVVEFNPLTMPSGDLVWNVSIRYKHHPVYVINKLEREVFNTDVAGGCGSDGQAVKKPMPVKSVGIRAHYLPSNANLTGPRLWDNTNYDKFTPDEYQS